MVRLIYQSTHYESEISEIINQTNQKFISAKAKILAYLDTDQKFITLLNCQLLITKLYAIIIL